MNRKSSLTGILMMGWVSLIFNVVLGVGSFAAAAKSPAGLAVDQFTASVQQLSPPVRLAAQNTTQTPGKMLAGAGLFGPAGTISPGEAGGILFFFLDREGDVLVPPPAPADDSPYRR